MTTISPDSTRSTNPLVRTTRALEDSAGLDVGARALRSLSALLIASPTRRDALRGRWLGHAVHPLLTDLPLGAWTSTVVLDLIGGRESRPAARRLLAFGVATAIPAAVTGVSEVEGTEKRVQRVAFVHAGANSAALAAFTASLVARRRGRHGTGVALALAGGLVSTVGGYLGGHLTEVRKVSSRHPDFLAPEEEVA